MLKVIVSPEARQDQLDLADYLQSQSGDALVNRFLDSLADAFALLATMPGIGATRDFGMPNLRGLRMWRIARFPYLVFYRVSGSELQVVRVLHGARDIETLFTTSE